MTDTYQDRLLAIVRLLPEEQARALLDYAEFLVGRHGQTPQPVALPDPLPIERPAQESVVGAIKRLSSTYPMLDRDKLFNETSALMMQHILKGQEAVEVIDELEELFHRHYKSLLER